MELLQNIWFEYKKYCIAGIGLLVVIVFALVGGIQKQVNDPVVMNQSQTSQKSKTKQHSKQVIFVDVKGAVKHPGVYKLSFGMRIQDAIAKAGGITGGADENHVNMAQQVRDQQVVYVPIIGEVTTPIGQDGSTATTSTDGSSTSSQPIVNINTAGKDELTKITGVGDKKADLILEYRQQHGQFKSIDDLKNVSGFGDKSVDKIKDQLAI